MDVQEIREKAAAIIKAGLVVGSGHPIPGHTCLESAIALAMGGPFDDKPGCVADPDREYGIAMNDAPWRSKRSRAEALLPLAMAQIGTRGTDRLPWLVKLRYYTITEAVVPEALDTVKASVWAPVSVLNSVVNAAQNCLTNPERLDELQDALETAAETERSLKRYESRFSYCREACAVLSGGGSPAWKCAEAVRYIALESFEDVSRRERALRRGVQTALHAYAET